MRVREILREDLNRITEDSTDGEVISAINDHIDMLKRIDTKRAAEAILGGMPDSEVIDLATQIMAVKNGEKKAVDAALANSLFGKISDYVIRGAGVVSETGNEYFIWGLGGGVFIGTMFSILTGQPPESAGGQFIIHVGGTTAGFGLVSMFAAGIAASVSAMGRFAFKFMKKRTLTKDQIIAGTTGALDEMIKREIEVMSKMRSNSEGIKMFRDLLVKSHTKSVASKANR